MCNRQNRKPSSVLSCHLSTQPTPWNEAGSLFTLAGFPVYMVLLALVPPPSYVAIWRRELLPRGFTLTLREGGLFSVAAVLRLLPPVLSTAGLPFPVRTFLWLHQRKVFNPQSPTATAPRGIWYGKGLRKSLKIVLNLKI